MAEKTFHSITLPGQDTARVPLTAAEFSTSVAYKVKDYCTYQGKLYRCTTAHAAGAWNAAHFTATDIDAEFDRKLDIPASQASAPANPRVGDLWIDNDENSPIYNVDASPTLNSTNAVQSGGTKVALNSLDSRKMEHGVITGDFSASVDYRVGDLVFYATTANGITTRTLYRCTTDHDTAAWNPTHFTATTLEIELQRVRDSEADTDMIGDLFGVKSTYAVGDYCIYNDNLYRCIQAVDNTGTTTPAFDPEDWTQVALANDVSDLNSALNILTIDGTQKIVYDFGWTAGYINASTGVIDTTVTGWRVSKPIPANEFYALYITTPNTIEVYAYNSDDSYYGRRNNLVAGIVDYQPVAGYLAAAAYCRLLTTVERANLLSAYIVTKNLITKSDFEDFKESNNNAFTVFYSDNGYLDLTEKIVIGGISGLGVIEPDDTRYLCTPEMIKLTGNNIKLLFTSSDFTVDLCFYKPDGSWWGRYPSTSQGSTTIISVPSFLQYQYYVRFMFRPVVSTNFAVSGIPNDLGIRVKIYPTEKTNKNIKVLSYNLRCLRNFSNADPDSAPLTEQEINICIETMANYIGDVNPDLFVACEDRPWFDAPVASNISGGTKSVYELLWSHWFPYKFDIEYGITVPRLYSKYPIVYGRRQDVSYPSGVQSVRPISTCLIYINKVPIWIIPVHATSDPTAYETDRVPYFQAIVDFCEDKDYVILAGDFNTDTEIPADELEVFVDAGFTLGNHGFFGDKKTYISGEGYTMNRLDNIITKGLTLNNFIVDNTIEYSDHYPVHSDITLSV